MENVSTKAPKTEEVIALKDFEKGRKTIKKDAKVTLRVDQAARLAEQEIVRRTK